MNGKFLKIAYRALAIVVLVAMLSAAVPAPSGGAYNSSPFIQAAPVEPLYLDTNERVEDRHVHAIPKAKTT